ncbi:DUF2161 domain-containing phosphodiesterase [Bacillus alkalisoli]|uniref:DUF2161 domain-containing phosphodiesterase n=1 Tax=Bacillus alkalisoli TaxID=2011008 RepID=UPI000C23A203|nr:DUF2161 family putative PD-(D/E)XK-type phosphodiesterase [Bacillus alkalisoli]
MTEKKKLLEVDLYKPIQTYLKKQGYEVRGEVKDCDIAAVKGDSLVIVELKLNLNIDLLLQATKRQKLTDSVYIAIPRPKNLRTKRWKELCQLVKRLELGLIVVAFTASRKRAEVVFEPTTYPGKVRKNNQKRDAILKEVNGRSGDYNLGGSSKTKIMTAYKENCIQIASLLEKHGPLSPKKLKELGTGDKTPSILAKNYYDWFDRVKRGTYVVNEKGIKEIKEHIELVDYYVGD